MTWTESIKNRQVDLDLLIKRVNQWRLKGETVVFTNGCFDLLHLGHLDYLARAADLGDRLVVAINSDASVQKIKGPERPVKDETSRAMVLSSLLYVDAIIIFADETPIKLIEAINPDYLVKGGDWEVENIVGGKHVIDAGGQVISLPFLEGHSTSSLIDKIK